MHIMGKKPNRFVLRDSDAGDYRWFYGLCLPHTADTVSSLLWLNNFNAGNRSDWFWKEGKDEQKLQVTNHSPKPGMVLHLKKTLNNVIRCLPVYALLVENIFLLKFVLFL